jgi:GTP cyclohydrolase II
MMDEMIAANGARTNARTKMMRNVHRALLEMRRGMPVRIDMCIEGGGAPFAAFAVEAADEDGLAELLAATEGNLALIVTGGRAAALGLDGGGDRALAVPRVGISAAGLLRLADPTAAGQAVRHDGIAGVAMPAGSEAAIKLAKLGRLLPAVLIGTLRPGAGGDWLAVEMGEIAAYPDEAVASLRRAAEAMVPLADAVQARLVAFRPADGGVEHLAIVIGAPEQGAAPLVRIHSECFTGDVLGSLRCDCGPQLHEAIARMQSEGGGIVLYMAQEGRGIGLVNKLRAYALQDRGLDTLDANRALGFRADERNFAPAAAMLRDLGFLRVRLLTNNPGKVAGLESYGIEVAGREPLMIAANGTNDDYLRTKALRFGHFLD